MSWILPFIVGLLTGIVSGFGIGGGSLLILYLTNIANFRHTDAAGINLLYFIFCAPAALVSHIRNKLIDWKVVIPTCISGVITCIIGSFLPDYLDISWIKRLFGILFIYIGVKELFCKKE